MKVALIYNRDMEGVINPYGRPNREIYNPNTVRMVEDALIAGGHNVRAIDGNIAVIEELRHFMPRVLDGERMGLVFNMAYGIQGENRYTHIPSLLEMLGIPYLGSTPAGHALALDKITTKILFQKSGLPTPAWWMIRSADDLPEDITFPLIVKPRMEAVSFGLRICSDRAALREAVDFILTEFRQDALAEAFIPGREFCVGLLGNRPPEAFPVLEIDLEGDPDAIQSEDDKRRQPRNKVCPAPIDGELGGRLAELSRRAFDALGLRDFSRVDFRVDSAGRPWILEINSMASLGRSGSYVAAAEAAGYDFTALVNRMLDAAALRCFADRMALETPAGRRAPSFPTRLRAGLRSRQDDIEDLLRRFAVIPAAAGNVEGARRIGQEAARALKALGFRSESIPGDDSPFPMLFRLGDGDPELVFLGRLDMEMREGEAIPFRESAGRFYGNGLWVHKGGLVVLIAALRALRSHRRLKGRNIAILLTAHNASSGVSTRRAVDRLTRSCRAVMGLHGAFSDGGVVSSRSGSAHWRAAIHLKSGGGPESILQAGRSMARLLDGARKLSRPDEGLLITPRSAGLRTELTGPWAEGEVELIVRYDTSDQIVDLESRLRDLWPRELKRLVDLRLEGGFGRPPMTRDAAVERLYDRLRSLADRLDIRLREEHRWAAADIGFVAEGRPRIDGLGPVGERPPRGEESILRHSLLERAALTALAVDDLWAHPLNDGPG